MSPKNFTNIFNPIQKLASVFGKIFGNTIQPNNAAKKYLNQKLNVDAHLDAHTPETSPSGNLHGQPVDAHLDAHTPETSPSGNLHGQPVSHLLGYGNLQLKTIGDNFPKLKPENLVFVGIRSFEPPETEFLQKLGVRIFYDDEIAKRGINDVMYEAIDRVSHQTYGFGISIDLDGFRINDAPAVGTPEEGGIIAAEFLKFIQSHPMEKLLVTELVEFMPQKDDENKTSYLLEPKHVSKEKFSSEDDEEVCPYGASSYDIPSVLLCDPSDKKPCSEGYTCEEAINSQMLSTYNMHLCCKSTTLLTYENVFYETKVGINKYSGNLSMPVFYVTSLSPSIIPIPPTDAVDYIVLNEYVPSKGPLPEVRTGDHFSKLPYKFREPVYLKKVVLIRDQLPGYYHHILVLFNPHGNPEAMNFYYNRPSSLSREIELTIPNWDEGAFFRTINRVLTITNDKVSTKECKSNFTVFT
uniref:Uncharacterized protein n=1 Tax=Panagrolaimus sp. ES5 TaxID=591445 RepID=A0AC34FE89_9BILA